MRSIDLILNDISGYVGRRTELCQYGGCWALFEFLRGRYPEAVAWDDPVVGHIYTQIDGCYYDSKGVYVRLPACAYILNGDDRRGISQMRRSAMRTLK